MQNKPLSRKTKGVIFIVLSAVSFTGMNTFVRLAGDVPTVQKMFFRNLVAMLFAFVWIVASGESLKIAPKTLKFHIIRSVSGLVGVFGNFYALDKIELSNASILNKMSPFFALVFSAIFLKEKVKPKQAAAIAIAFAGALLIIKPSFSNVNFLASAAGLMGGACAGGAYTCVRKLGILGENSKLTVLFFSAFSCAVTAPYLIFNFSHMALMQWLYLILAGVCAAFGQFTITAAYTFAPSREISVYDYSQVLFAAVTGYFLFGELPDLWSFAGYIIICSMAVWMFFYNNKPRHSEKA
ncbi:MAG: DMT family transporter [Clostridiales bacterium]|nr:DMT family transporter [Clostridiales bacterium]